MRRISGLVWLQSDGGTTRRRTNDITVESTPDCSFSDLFSYRAAARARQAQNPSPFA
jgi:hypothetical protein